MPRLFAGLMLVVALGCSSASSPSAPDAAAAEAPAGDVQLVSFSVPQMTCPGGCAPVVKATLEEMPGVVQCDVDFDSKTAICRVEKSQTLDSDAALAALAEAGFKDSAVKQ